MKHSEIVDFIRSRFTTEEFIPLHEPRFLGNEKKYLLDCIDSTFVSSVGEYVSNFEKQLALYCGVKYAVATVNGTAALHLALRLAGVKRDELVLTQALSFVSTSNAISYTGASPAFIDVDTDTLGMSPDKLNLFLTEHTVQKEDGCYHLESSKKISACVPMHTFGHPCRIEEIAVICANHNIALVEDAAEAMGSFYKTKHAGTFGLMGILSFNGNKILTCGGGGAILTNDEVLAQKAKHLSTQAKVPHPWEFQHDALAYNYRMPNINAALACAQLEQLPHFLQSKRVLADAYATFFAPTNFTFIKEPQHAVSNYWLCALLLKDKEERDAFLNFTNKQGIMTRPTWNLLNNLEWLQPAIAGDLSNSIALESKVVCIPSSVRL